MLEKKVHEIFSVISDGDLPRFSDMYHANPELWNEKNQMGQTLEDLIIHPSIHPSRLASHLAWDTLSHVS